LKFQKPKPDPEPQNGWDPKSPYKPIDAQDTCYMHHDICYGEGRICCRNQTGCYDDCVRKKFNGCDNDLMKCLINIGMSGDALSDALRSPAIPVIFLKPPFREAVDENKKEGTSWWFIWRF
jgi:hypothetical protein